MHTGSWMHTGARIYIYHYISPKQGITIYHQKKGVVFARDEGLDGGPEGGREGRTPRFSNPATPSHSGDISRTQLRTHARTHARDVNASAIEIDFPVRVLSDD